MRVLITVRGLTNGRTERRCGATTPWGARGRCVYILPPGYARRFRQRLFPDTLGALDPLNLSSLVTVSVALSRPRVLKAELEKLRVHGERQPGSYGNSLTGSEPGTEGRGTAETLSMERGGEVVMEWWCARVVRPYPSCHGRENIGGSALPAGPRFKDRDARPRWSTPPATGDAKSRSRWTRVFLQRCPRVVTAREVVPIENPVRQVIELLGCFCPRELSRSFAPAVLHLGRRDS